MKNNYVMIDGKWIKNRVPETRIEILVKNTFTRGFTWNDHENYFNINHRRLEEELKERFLALPNYDQRMEIFNAQMQINESGLFHTNDFEIDD